MPSVCVTVDESKSLPAGVFDCDSNNDDDDDIYDFGLKDGRIIQLRENPMERGSDESQFCDSSSKSIR